MYFASVWKNCTAGQRFKMEMPVIQIARNEVV
jgi:hypothetical protein